MKYLKLFESYSDIKSICEKYGIVNYSINSDGSIDVDGVVNLYNEYLTVCINSGFLNFLVGSASLREAESLGTL